MSATVPIELAEVIGYSLCAWPVKTTPFHVPHALEVYDSVEEARQQRDFINRGDSEPRVCIVEVRRVVIE